MSSTMLSASLPSMQVYDAFADQLAYFERDLWPATVRSRLPSPEQTKTSTMPPNDGRRFRDRQGVHDAWRNPIEAGENQTIEIIEGKPLRRFSSQHIEPGGAAPRSLPEERLVI
jgi:hypothetical protein